jgi:hypothetical protein
MVPSSNKLMTHVSLLSETQQGGLRKTQLPAIDAKSQLRNTHGRADRLATMRSHWKLSS